MMPIQEISPLATWDDDNSKHENLVWWSRLDKKFQVEVQRTGPSTGILVIFDHSNENKCLHREDVDLAYGALFGPDVDDVSDWQDIAINVIDAIPG